MKNCRSLRHALRASARSLVALAAMTVVFAAGSAGAQTISFSGASAYKNAGNTGNFTSNGVITSTGVSSTTNLNTSTATQIVARYSYGVGADTGIAGSSQNPQLSANWGLSFTVTTPGAFSLNVSARNTGAMTRVDDGPGNASADVSGVTTTVTENGAAKSFASGTLNLADPGVLGDGGGTANTPYNVTASGTINGTSNGNGVAYVFTSTFTARANTNFRCSGFLCISQGDEGAVRGGDEPGIGGETAGDYPGQGSRDRNNDGHFIQVDLVNKCGDGNVDSSLGETCDVAGAGSAGSCCGLGCTFRPSTYACRQSAGECDAVDYCTGSSSSCSDGKQAAGTSCSEDGNPCSLNVCDGSSNTCTYPAGNAGTVCRSAAGICDAVESCTGTSTTCPNDAKLPNTTLCRAAADECDANDFCSGTSNTCSSDGKQNSGTACADDGNPCTRDVCSGSANACTHPAGNQGATCRGKSDECDVAETCTGSSSECPVDKVKAQGSICRSSGGVCDKVEVCDGTAKACPADAKKAAGTACAADSKTCTLDQCDGSSNACQHPAGNAGTTCRTSAGICDVAELCDGQSTECPGDSFKPSSTVCRASAGICDVDDFCPGNAAACTTDAREPSTKLCRGLQTTCATCEDAGSGQSDCDLEEYCNGGVSCPTDLTKPDQDGDALCNQYDNCPRASNRPFTDGDADGPGDACDVCNNVDEIVIENLFFSLKKANTVAKDDEMVFNGTINVPAGTTLDPKANGMRMRMEDPTVANTFDAPEANRIADVSIPGGNYNNALKVGWTKSGNNWTYSNLGTIVPLIGGITQIVVTQNQQKPLEYSFAIQAKNGSYPLPKISTDRGFEDVTEMAMKVVLSFQTPLATSGSCAEELFDQSNTTWNVDRSLMTVQ